MKLYYFKTTWAGLFSLLFSAISAQSSPNLEFASRSGIQIPTGNGPAYNASIEFVKNTNNPSGTNYAVYQPNLKADFSLGNQSYNSAVIMGYNINNNSAPIYPKINYIGTPANGDFTSSGAPIGQGISVSGNNGLSLFYNTAVLGSRSTTGTYPMADLMITFNRPVDHPVLHIGALGAFRDQLGIAGGLELIESNVPVSFTRISGNNANFSVTATGIRNSSQHPNDVGPQSASGSVRVNGTGITRIKLRMTVRGDGGEATWGSGSGDLITLGISVLESDLSVSTTINNSTPQFNEIVTFTIKAKNNGASNNTGVEVASFLPDGYEVLSTSTTAGTYNINTGIWSIDQLNDGIERELVIQAKVKNMGSHTVTSIISGDLRDPLTDNNSASITPSVSGNAACYNDPNTNGAGSDSRFGITLLKRAGKEDAGNNWPMVRKSSHMVLESNTKGFVITRISKSELSNIAVPVEGMMIYDTTDKCLKIYSDSQWSCFSQPACP